MKTYKDYINEYTKLRGAVVGGLAAGPLGAAVGAMSGNSRRKEAARQKADRDGRIEKIKHQAKRKLEKADPKKKEKIRANRDKAIEREMIKFKKKWGKHDY